MGWLRSVGSIKSKVSFAEYRDFCRALVQKRPIIVSILLTKATPYLMKHGESCRCCRVCRIQSACNCRIQSQKLLCQIVFCDQQAPYNEWSLLQNIVSFIGLFWQKRLIILRGLLVAKQQSNTRTLYSMCTAHLPHVYTPKNSCSFYQKSSDFCLLTEYRGQSRQSRLSVFVVFIPEEGGRGQWMIQFYCAMTHSLLWLCAVFLAPVYSYMCKLKYIYVYAYTQACVCMIMFAHTQERYLQEGMYECKYAPDSHTYTSPNTHTNTHEHANLKYERYVCTHICLRIYSYIRMYMYVYIEIYL